MKVLAPTGMVVLDVTQLPIGWLNAFAPVSYLVDEYFPLGLAIIGTRCSPVPGMAGPMGHPGFIPRIGARSA